MKIIKGDLIKLALAGKFDSIVHGCNCFCTMGGGIAKTIKNEFPEAYEADCKTEKGSKDKLGTYSHATIARGGNEITVINAYTQHDFKGPGMKADYDAIRAVFRKIKSDFSGKRIGYPKIGAGLAGGDWDQISKIIDEELAGEDHTLVAFAPQ
jgi:O-acetyl-ADP-ribose deacetylase (regulator of RNase III)